jgi:hypothetical protein
MWRTKPTDFVTKVGKKFKLLYKPHNYGTRWRTKPTDFVTKVGKQINAKIRKLLLILARHDFARMAKPITCKVWAKI